MFATARADPALTACAEQMDRLSSLFARLGQEVRAALDSGGRAASA
jgi:hypothetical protein